MTTTPARAVYQVTEWMRPHDTVEIVIDATLMKIPNRNWAQMEVERWDRRNNRECWLQENKEGMVALFSWAEYQRPVEGEE